jgi:hypothetical protein
VAFAGFFGLGAFKVIPANTGMGVQHQKRRFLAQKMLEQADQQRVLHAVGKIACVVDVAIVHAEA